ncbi:AAA domain-containing protein [Faunimonas pinastri]|uniref:AAA domain-containing protein n=1 Tax=Faunimonas pinastri TaxID=1855383 RepID=A0A1H9MWE3_9HYPH|nr:AAA family ATPase [Faunimonas pinastri]SER28024.1 AAA domain-containing protein [Faunimonas pinastri]
MFGLIGAHRTGKTTLAKKVAEDLGIHFHETSTTKVMKELGYDAVADLPMAERITAQEKLLDRHIKDLQKLPRPCITDRTPLDMLAYALGELTMHNADSELAKRYAAYADRCLETTRLYYDTLVLLRPLPTYEEDPTKPPANRAYQTLIQLLIEGGVDQVGRDIEGTSCLINTLDLGERTEACKQVLTDRMQEIAREHSEIWLH